MFEVFCVALAIYYEARGEPYAGQVAVASVIYNRMESPLWPDKACDVVVEPRQFEFYPPSYPIDDKVAWRKAMYAALEAQTHPNTPALYFSQPGYRNRTPILVIGNHNFYID